MDKSKIAEWILTLVMPPSRAAPIVGDFMEDARVRGSLCFWTNILRVALAHLTLAKNKPTNRPVRVYVGAVYLLIFALGFWLSILRHPTAIIHQHIARFWSVFIVLLFIALSPLTSLRISRWVAGLTFGLIAVLGARSSFSTMPGPPNLDGLYFLPWLVAWVTFLSLTCLTGWLSYSFLFGRKIRDYLHDQAQSE